jgi:predicted NBD/HSP70 family sugar kinase
MHVAIDWGGSTVRVAGYESFHSDKWTVCERFDVQKVDKSATDAQKAQAATLDYANLCKAIYAVSGTPQSISVAMAGKVDPSRTTLIGAGNLIHWVGQPIVELLSMKFECPVVLGNDAEAAALAEANLAYIDGRPFRLVIWGSGVGGCLLLWHKGEPVAYSGEMGHQHLGMGASDTLCGCGSYDCLEAWCGGDNIAKRHNYDLGAMPRDEWEYCIPKMVRGLGNTLINDPVPLVVCSGGVACKQAWMLPIIGEQLACELTIGEVPELVISMFGESVGTHGARALGREMIGNGLFPVS